jgi:hypothetical protein
MNAPVDIALIMPPSRRGHTALESGEITPEELQRENSFIWSAADIFTWT